MNASMYAFCFVVLILGWPTLLAEISVSSTLILGGLNTAIFGAVAFCTTSSELSWWKGLRVICASYMSGCANITILYIFPLLLVYYVRMIWATYMGVFKGKKHTQQWWLKTVSNRV